MSSGATSGSWPAARRPRSTSCCSPTSSTTCRSGSGVALLRSLAELLVPGGTLLVVTSVATPQLTSRHFDLLLRAQEEAMELPDTDVLVGQLAEAGLEPAAPRRIAPGTPLVTVSTAHPS